ncbi:MAG: DNA-directed RNA polymerase subunit A' [Candidatus Bathyarchaeia archaeon]|jgi:DNA-directed RNA polymerase subunit A'|nr:DNA-directed RNA polymerase subunit A' [Candidatus Bathyarchaeota archaeon A05DMB-4]MDH7595381.1 DNA-directed RNA polymerase subunit A' [Candidatus Bathyarchaeota archaeon]
MAATEEAVHKIVEQLRFGLLSPQEIRKLSVAEIQTADTYDEDGAPITSGLMDGRLGTLEPRQRCKTCGNTAIRCPGHFGHIELAVPVIHIEFTKIINNLLNSTCRNCGRILLPAERLAKLRTRIVRVKKMLGVVPNELYKKVLDEAKGNECPYCGAVQHKLEFTKPTSFHEMSEEGAQRLTPSMIRERLERIPDDDLELFGFDPKSARPEWMILQVLPVPPVYVRPSITLESGIRSEDDLTHKLVDIIRINQRLKENMEAGAPTLIIQDLSELLQYHVTTYFNNEASGIPPARHRSGRALKTLSQRLKGKEGRFRSNLSGKRVDFSARTVISPDPNLDINEVGVPLEVATKLSMPEKVTEWNIEEMRKLVSNGPSNYPGALYVVRPDGKRIRLEFVVDQAKVAEAIEPGFIVERHLRDGDIAIFNRQPSLHRMSIMAHYVRVLPYKTFRLHLCVCPPYNADFDGDEMNLHIPQSEEAQTEARLLMQVQDQILSPRFGGPIIGAIRDFITSAYLFTRRTTLLTKEEVCRLLLASGYDGPLPEPQVKKPEPLWTGKQIFSLFLPKDFNYTLKATICQGCTKCKEEECEYDAYVVIKDGVLKAGVIDRRSIGAEQSESIFHRIIKDYGTETGREFLNKICQLLKQFTTMRGFTYSHDELELSPAARQKINRTIQKYEDNVAALIEKYRKGTLERLPGQTLEESFEIYALNELAHARDEAGKIADQDFSLENSGIVMTRTGARGSSLNIGQMAACVGQQSVRGKRIMRGYLDRALPHFKPGDSSPKARGFVHSSYQSGLDTVEFFFHAMGGREGLVDTAVRTQQSGYMQRRLINALEHLRVEYDGTVRNSTGEIIQFVYGEDGVDPAKSDHGKAVNVARLVDQIKISVQTRKPADQEYIEKKLKEVETQLTPILVEQLKSQLTKAELGKEAVDQAIHLTVENYKRALVEPGEAVGIVGAQSIGEPGTQMTLRTFHYAGVREQNVTLGLPRLIEIVDARRIPSTPIMTIYLTKEFSKSKEKATEVAREIIATTVEDVAKSVFDDPEKEEVVIELNPALMKERGVSPKELEEALHFPNCEVKIKEKTVRIKPKKAGDRRKLIGKVTDHLIKGVPGIRRVLVSEEKGEWVIRTDGSNLSRVLEIENVDPTRTTTNHVHEIAKTLGIEAARNAIMKEAEGVLEEQGLDVDIRHVMLVADMMTATGEIRQIGRHGISGEKSSVLARAAFEITIPNIVDAVIKGESDPLKGVTENVIVGQAIPIGTGLVDLYMSALVESDAKTKKAE